MIEATIVVLLTAVVTFGCSAIYDLRWHVREMIGVAALLAIVLGAFAFIVAVVEAPRIEDDTIARVTAHEAR